jgi:hypothetical protein
MDSGFYDYGEGITALDAFYERPRLNAIHVVIQRGRAAIIDTKTAPYRSAEENPPDVLRDTRITHAELALKYAFFGARAPRQPDLRRQ